MSEIFKAHLEKFIKIEEAEFEDIIRFFQSQTVKKRENLLTEGQVCRTNFFVTNGILRKFFIKDNGVEQTTEFAIENWWMTDHFSFLNQSETEFYIQAVEKTSFLSIGLEAQEELLARYPVMEKYFRCVYQKSFAATQMRIKFMYDFSREELYQLFRKSQPEFLQRVPQYLIASYLGFTPEYLSQIRRKRIS